MKKRNIYIIWLIIAIVLFFVVFSVARVFGGMQSPNIYTDFEQIAALNIFTDESLLDDKVNNLDIIYSKCGTITIDSQKYNVFIYEFKTEEDAAIYYSRHAKNANSQKGYNYNITYKLFNSWGIVYKDNRAYSYYGGNYLSHNEFIKYINSVFSERLTD